MTDRQAVRCGQDFAGVALARCWAELAKRPEGFICTDAATESQKIVGGVVYGYYAEDNPDGWLGQGEGGHDFLVVEDRWILDFWAAAYHGQCPVWDIIKDVNAVHSLYGPRKRWTRIEDRPAADEWPRFIEG
jgi:hypothetical protein